MKRAIGFANKFYTLWTIDVQPRYFTDANGQYHLSGSDTHYTYHKNISIDLEKAKSLHPNIEFIEGLRGKSESWVSKGNEDLCPQFMKFGKYWGQEIELLIEKDFQYIIWVCENRSYCPNAIFAMGLPKVQEYFASIKKAETDWLEKRNNAFLNLLEAGSYEFIPLKNLSMYKEFAYLYVSVGDLAVTFKFPSGSFSYNEYNGFAYGLPIVKGKAKRMKGKLVRFEFEEDKEESYQVIVTGIEIKKNAGVVASESNQ